MFDLILSHITCLAGWIFVACDKVWLTNDDYDTNIITQQNRSGTNVHFRWGE